MVSVDIRSVPGTVSQALPLWWKRFDLQWWHDYSSFTPNVNWSDFTVIALDGELCWHMGNAEIHAALLGVHLRGTWYWHSEERDALVELKDAVIAGEIPTIPFDELRAKLGTAEGDQR